MERERKMLKICLIIGYVALSLCFALFVSFCLYKMYSKQVVFMPAIIKIILLLLLVVGLGTLSISALGQIL